jgi:Family of unknown function (DUF6847)
MIVGEALSHRADLQKRVGQIQDRLQTSVLVQEGDRPPESPDELLSELGSICDELQELIAKINHTNAGTRLPTGETVTEGLARRDVIDLEPIPVGIAPLDTAQDTARIRPRRAWS